MLFQSALAAQPFDGLAESPVIDRPAKAAMSSSLMPISVNGVSRGVGLGRGVGAKVVERQIDRFSQQGLAQAPQQQRRCPLGHQGPGP